MVASLSEKLAQIDIRMGRRETAIELLKEALRLWEMDPAHQFKAHQTRQKLSELEE
jgi:hypothetical protein